MSDDQNTQPQGEQPNGVDTQAEVSAPAQDGGENGSQPVQPEVGESAQPSESEATSENTGEQPAENTETPAEPTEGSGEAPTEAGNVEPADPVQPENETQATEPTGADESPREPNVATQEEREELKRLEFKRTQMPISGDEVARIDYLKTLKHE